MPRPLGYTRAALNLSLIEAAVASGMFAAIETWMVPLLQIRLGAAAHLMGLLSIVPQVASIALSPWALPLIARCGGNKAVAVGHSFLQALFLVLLTIPLQMPAGPATVPLAMTLIILISVVGVLGGPAWIAWMGDLIPQPIRGSFNARRTRLFHTFRLANALIFAGLASVLPLTEGVWGIQAIILLAAAARIAGTMVMLRQPEPEPRPGVLAAQVAEGTQEVPALAGLLAFLRDLPRTDLGRWTSVWAALNVGNAVSGPFFIPYLLATGPEGGLDLRHQPWLLTVLMYTSTVVRLSLYPVAGRLVDLHGPEACLRIAVIIIAVTPIGWILAPDAWWLILPEAFTGVGWCLADCSVGTMLMGCHPDAAKRSALIGRHQTVLGISVVLGGSLGVALMSPGVLTGLMPAAWGRISDYHAIFAISAAVRVPGLVMAWILLPRFKVLPPHLHHEGSMWRLIPGSGVGLRMMGYLRR